MKSFRESKEQQALSYELRNSYIVQLAKINENFCNDSVEFRWQTKNDVTIHQPRNDSITKIGWMRSVECVEPNTFFFVMEFDSNGLNKTILDATKKSALVLKNITGIMPVMKASGKSGSHIYQKIHFPLNYSKRKCQKCKEDLAQTIYNKANLSKMGINIGKLTKKELGDSIGFVDMRMYESRRMLRGFSVHPGSGLFAVPFVLEDDIPTISKRMRGNLPMPLTSFHTIQWMPHFAPDSYDFKKDLENKNVDVNAISADMILNIKSKKRGDRYYMCLTPKLKAITSMEGDITHDLKVLLISTLRFMFSMSVNEIKEWIIANVKWSDLDPNSQETDYHIRYTCNWIDTVIFNREYEGPDPEQPPIKAWVLFDIEEEK